MYKSVANHSFETFKLLTPKKRYDILAHHRLFLAAA